MIASLTAAQVAAEFGHAGKHAAEWLHRARPQLEARGFPRPLPRVTARAQWRWPAGEVKAWVAAERAGVPHAANDGGAAPGGLEIRRAALRARAVHY